MTIGYCFFLLLFSRHSFFHTFTFVSYCIIYVEHEMFRGHQEEKKRKLASNNKKITAKLITTMLTLTN
ncbi:hypothetical protein DERF_006480 [Dermatophagoides farinae]|uniref:Secreted protein n=1 Tax=Dermatophagoides farinae TaxID=6954 RepID=A0A922L763_DERFA|nr:hypothetical protein DERF_006480 [Dermatophagoides farinae]